MSLGSPRKVLFVHHASGNDGMSISILTLVKHLDPSRYAACFLLVGNVAEPMLSILRGMGIPARHLPAPLTGDWPWYGLATVDWPWRKVPRLFTSMWRAFHSDPKIAAYYRAERPDVVHITEHIPVSPAVTAHELGLPVVWHCRHVFLWTRPVVDPGRRVMRVMGKVSKTVICISESEAAQFHGANVEVIYNPMDFAKTDAAYGRGGSARESLGLDKEDYVVMAPIGLGATKGAWDFINACGVAAKLAPEVALRFLIVGHVPAAARRHLLRRWTGVLGPRTALDYARLLARRAGIEDRIHFTGFRKDVYEIMHAADLVVFPSRLRACGRPCFEAGALGKPILVTMPDKNTGVVLDGKTGLILPEKNPEALGEAIAALARDRAVGARMGECGFEHVRYHFDPARHAQRVMAVYDRAVARWGKSGLNVIVTPAAGQQ